MKRRWTIPEMLRVLGNLDKTDNEIAAEIGRTRKAVEHQRLAWAWRKRSPRQMQLYTSVNRRQSPVDTVK